MTLTIAGIEFSHHDYDERGDTLYLSVGELRRQPPAAALETLEGHTVEYDEHGAVVAVELLNVRWTLERAGELTLTWPPAHLAAGQLQSLLAAA